ncbi:hypothetical protein [Macrococcoides caseolyticum]|uniref:hypothetical protein n=1 Tax=Macrococcoides caseolyticum TaxID=69966 RepID=UPI0018E34FBA|nr:hypothetical protein [Macrococcus caseolyticus]
MTNIDYEKELQALEDKKKQLLKEKREKDKKELQALKAVFGKDFPRKENGKFISLDEFKQNYVIAHKDQSGIDQNQFDEVFYKDPSKHHMMFGWIFVFYIICIFRRNRR